MVERKKPSITILPLEFQRQLSFDLDPSGEWLFNDEFVEAGGDKFGEWLPARARVSKDGTRFEVGARRQDLEGLLELNRIIRPSVQTVETVVNFWENHPKFATRVEDGWIFIGAKIEPTLEGLETDFNPVLLAYEVALESAISGRSYKELTQDKGWYGDVIRHIEGPVNQRTGLFGRTASEEETKRQSEEKPEKGGSCELRPQITADNLRDFPLDSHRTSLHGTPGTLVRDGESKELKNMWIIAHNGQPTVDIIGYDTQYDRDKREWTDDDTRLQLPIPEGVEIKTVADLARLKTLHIFDDDKQPVQELDVNVTVENNSFRIVSLDGSFSLEVRTLACTDCQLPYWKFPRPNPEEREEDLNPYKEFGIHSVRVGGVGGYQCHVDTKDGKKLYCYDCVKKLEAAYLKEHPTARRSTAIKIARAKLTEAAYPDVQILDTQVWRIGNKGWELFTYIDYERDGKTITRKIGTPTITDDGEFQPNMPSREYINFRYKAA